MPRLGPFLQLSREHHTALVLARDIAALVSPLAPEALSQFNARVAGYWQAEMQSHFAREEAILTQHPHSLPSALQQRLLEDHRVLAEGARRAETQALDEPALRDWGQRLAAHIRMEERECFLPMQAALGLD